MEHLRIPGPTPCPPEVLQAMTKQMINHRGDEMGQIINDITIKLKQIFQTENDVLILTGSGTGGTDCSFKLFGARSGVRWTGPGSHYRPALCP